MAMCVHAMSLVCVCVCVSSQDAVPKARYEVERAREAAHSELHALQAQLTTAHSDLLTQSQETKSQQRRAELATARAKQLESMLSQTRADAFRRGLEGQQAGGRLSVLHEQNMQLVEQVGGSCMGCSAPSMHTR